MDQWMMAVTNKDMLATRESQSAEAFATEQAGQHAIQAIFRAGQPSY
jgi:hypothetical protein